MEAKGKHERLEISSRSKSNIAPSSLLKHTQQERTHITYASNKVSGRINLDLCDPFVIIFAQQ